MTHAWVCGGLALPNSAVPVLPNVPGGSPAPAAVPPDCTTLAMNARNVATTPASSGAIFGTFGLGWVVSTGACHWPAATAAATDAMCAGLTSTRPWPIDEAATSARSFGVGYEPPAAGGGSTDGALKPNCVAVRSSAPGGSLSARPMNALLQEILNAPARSSAPDASPSKFLNTRPYTWSVGGHGAGVVPVLPLPRSAADVTTLNVEPGSYVPASARL